MVVMRLLTLAVAACQAYIVCPVLVGQSTAAKARHASAVAQGGAQGDEKFVLPGFSSKDGEKLGFINKNVKRLADRFSENEKGFGLLTYSKDDRTAQASHILLSFEDYPDDGELDGMTMGKALKQKILDGELSFELVAEKFSACASADSIRDSPTPTTSSSALGTL